MAVERESMCRFEGSRRDGFAAVDAQFRDRLRTYFRRTGLGFSDADDLTQDVFIRLTKTRIDDLRNIDAFVFTIACNLVRDRFRRSDIRAARRSVDIDDADLVSRLPTPDQVLENSQALEAVSKALTKLKPAARQAFYWKHIEGLSYVEIGTLLGVSVSMVEKHIMTAIAALRMDCDG